MRDISKSWFVPLLAAAVLDQGCSLAPVRPGQAVDPGPNQGIAAVVMDSLDELQQVAIDRANGGGESLSIAEVPKGVHLYLFVVSAGDYCFTSFHFGLLYFHPTDMSGRVCFKVTAGKIAYSGNVGPRVFGKDDTRIGRDDRRREFEQKLNAEYPGLAARYPIVNGW